MLPFAIMPSSWTSQLSFSLSPKHQLVAFGATARCFGAPLTAPDFDATRRTAADRRARGLWLPPAVPNLVHVSLRGDTAIRWPVGLLMQCRPPDRRRSCLPAPDGCPADWSAARRRDGQIRVTGGARRRVLSELLKLLSERLAELQLRRGLCLAPVPVDGGHSGMAWRCQDLRLISLIRDCRAHRSCHGV